MACIPVTVRPQFDDTGLPIALPVTPVGHISPTGELASIYPVSMAAPTGFDWGTVGTVIGAVTTALLAAYGINAKGFASKAVSALKIASELADKQEATSDPEMLRANKLAAMERQRAAGVLELTQKARGKKLRANDLTSG
ncbi:MAG: hypothetical protein ACRCWJ_12175 [Casimicrobium sp.]